MTTTQQQQAELRRARVGDPGTRHDATPKVTGEQAVNQIKTQPVTFLNAASQQQTISLPANATVEARQLVVYARPAKDPPSGLEIRLAWEIDVTNGPIKQVYLDAISNEIIATS